MPYKKAASPKFRDFSNDDANIFSAERAKIDFEVALIGKLTAAREANGLAQAQLTDAAGLAQSAGARLETVESCAAD
ncbi:MAG: hypothetical protein LBP22_15780 [Deltaproteobacteria bacterium]|jgi:hypothetical protein|nr:hypothetical protein [Deltaproteobacteria bacterium]